MAVTGTALVLFLTIHAGMNVVALFSAKTYNAICEFIGAHWYALAVTALLAGLVFVHFVLAFIIERWNLQTQKTEAEALQEQTETSVTSGWNMFSLGTVVVLGLGLHLYHFWSKMMFAELADNADSQLTSNGIFHIMSTFHGMGEHTVAGYAYTLIYLVWLAALWLHLNHGIWSAMQTLGRNSGTWVARLKAFCTLYSSLIILLFAAVAVLFCLGYTPADIDEVMPR